jgi:tyrosinase
MTKNALRLVNFGLPLNAIKNIDDMEQDENTELIGANGGSIALDATGARTTVKLDSKGLKTVAKSIKTFSALSSENITGFNLPDEVFLELEGIRGNADANIYSVTVNQHFVGHVFLFGLRKASQKDGEHGGGGLNIAFDITKIIDQLHLSDKDVTELNSLDIVIQPTGPVYENEKCTIERVSIYRKGQV